MCAESLGDNLVTQGYALGLVYTTPAFAPHLSSILTFLSEKTRIPHWAGGVAHGVCSGEHEYHQGGALVAMVMDLPPESYVIAHEHDRPPPDETTFALLHALDASFPLSVATDQTYNSVPRFLIGGIMKAASFSPAFSAERATASPLSGVFCTQDHALISGITQGCRPLGQTMVVTKARNSVIMELDGRPALDMLKEQAGDLIARRLEQAAGYIHTAIPMADDDRVGFCVRPLTGIDRNRGWLASAIPFPVGSPLLFVRRDANSAQDDMRRMLHTLKQRAGSRKVRGGIYISCTGRGPRMFGPGSHEMRMIRHVFPDNPLIGFFADGQIFRDSLHAYAATLTLFLEENA